MKTLYFSFLILIFSIPLKAFNCDNHKVLINQKITRQIDDIVTVQIKITVIDSLTGNTIPHPCKIIPTDPLTPSFGYFVEFGDGMSVYTSDSIITHNYSTWSESAPYIRVKVNYIYGDEGEPPSRSILLSDTITTNLPKNQKRVFVASEVLSSALSLNFDAPPSVGRRTLAFINIWVRDTATIPLNQSVNGEIRFYYNDSKNAPNGFDFIDQSSRLFHLDSFISDNAVNASDPNFSQFEKVAIWKVNDFIRNELRTIYFDFESLPSLEAEPTRFLNFRVELEIEGTGIVQAQENNLQPLLIARDPNRMLAYELEFEPEDRYLRYKVQFQNTGESTEDSVTIDLELDPRLNTDSIKILKISPIWGEPKIDLLFIDDTVRVVFDNIILRGLNEEIPGPMPGKYRPSNSIGFLLFETFHKADTSLDAYELQNKAYLRFGRLDTTIVTNVAINKAIRTTTTTTSTTSRKWSFGARLGINLPFQYQSFKIRRLNPFTFKNTLFGIVVEHQREELFKPYFRSELTLNNLNYKDINQEELDLFFLELSAQMRFNLNNQWSTGIGLNLNTLLNAKSNTELVDQYSQFKLGVLGDLSFKLNSRVILGARLNVYYNSKLFNLKSAFFPVGEVYFLYNFIN